MSADLEKLLPCPFCGEPAKSYVSRDDDHDRYGEVCCTGCAASVRGPHLHWMDNTADEIASQFQAEMGWNRRTPDLARQVIALTADNAALRAKMADSAETKLPEDALRDAAKALLDAWDGADKAERQTVYLAASFGAQAFTVTPVSDARPGAMFRATMQAVIDPTSPDLDWLRAKNRVRTIP